MVLETFECEIQFQDLDEQTFENAIRHLIHELNKIKLEDNKTGKNHDLSFKEEFYTVNVFDFSLARGNEVAEKSIPLKSGFIYLDKHLEVFFHCFIKDNVLFIYLKTNSLPKDLFIQLCFLITSQIIEWANGFLHFELGHSLTFLPDDIELF